jgi:uncharacterized delta-60 repeat protein
MVLLAGCGGGGNGAGGGSSPPPPGSASTFDQARSFNDSVTGIVPVNDGSGDVVVAGVFTTYTDVVSNRLIRLHADGTVAQAFPDGFNDFVLSLVSARDSSGAMYALGNFTQFNGQPAAGIIRLNRDGSRDTNFQLAAMDQFPSAMAPIPDGSGAVYIGGLFTHYGGVAIRHLARLRANGSLDQSFSTGEGFTGISDGEGGVNNLLFIQHMAVEEIGSRRLYVQGLFGSYRGMSVPGFLRILLSGEIDPTFLNGSFPGASPFVPSAETLLPTADGKIYVGGRALGLVRVNENGSIDQSFAPPQLSTTMVASAGDATGDIFVSGFSQFRRLRPDGSPAPTFQEPTINDQVSTVLPVGDGSTDIYAGGSFTAYAGNGVNHLARVHSNGTLASQTVRGSGFSIDVRDVEAGGEGGVYVVINFPVSNYNGTVIRPLVRLLSNGTLDPTFLFRENLPPAGTGGFVLSATGARNDGRLYVTGTLTEYDGHPVEGVMRLFPDGRLDQSFVPNGSFGGFGEELSVVPAVSPPGTLYAFGGTPQRLVRLTSSGAVDPTFAIGSGFDPCCTNNTVSTVVPNEDGSIYVSGFFETFNGETVPGLVRLDSTGRRDPTFLAPTGVKVQAVARDGSPFVIGRVYPNTRLQKLRRDGTVDPTFNADPVPGAITKIFLLSNDRLAVLGAFGTDVSPSFPLRGYVMLLDQTGRQDSTFGVRTLNSVLTTPFTIAEADDGTGDIFLGGVFTRYENHTMQRIARLNSDGSAD